MSKDFDDNIDSAGPHGPANNDPLLPASSTLNFTGKELEGHVNGCVSVPALPAASWPEARTTILTSIDPVDFEEEAEGQFSERNSLKAFTVLVIRVLLRILSELNIGLCRMGAQVYCFLGTYWKRIDHEDLIPFFGEVAETMGVPRLTADHHSFRKGLVQQFQTTSTIPTPEPLEEKILINFRNLTLEIMPEGKIERPFAMGDYLMYQLPFDYDPTAKAPRWETFLDEVLPDKESQRVLAEGFARAFTDIKLEKVLMLHGSGANGKSVVMDVMQAVFGPDAVTNYSLKNLEHPYYRAEIANKLLNICSEASTGMDPDEFKKLASGEPIDARVIYQEPFIVKRYAKLVFSCNEFPDAVEHTPAFFRRFLIIPFIVTIPPDQQDPDLARKIIEAESAGVFNWVLEGLDRLNQQKHFSECAAAAKELERYRLESDSIALFLDEKSYKPSKENDQRIRLSDLHQEYRSFCTENLYRPTSTRKMKKRLIALGYETEKINIGVVVYAERFGHDAEEISPLLEQIRSLQSPRSR